MPLFGKVIVIKRNGTDGIHFPLTASSCLFGRRTECDIRIQLPQVSKEHCKIEVNENQEAILTNLSTVNPTQLNGSSFQQPVPLKHGDVLTIIDRSFRFEYPLQSTPRRRPSRSPKDEARQVLHVQQVAEVELSRKQTSGSKRSSGHSECEEQNADENKQSTEENMCKPLPVKLQTPKSSYKTKQSVKKESEMSPFTKLYETLKHEIKGKKSLQEGNVPGKEGGKGALQEPSARIASSCDLVSPTKENEIGRSENNEEYKMKQELIGSEFNQISMVGSATKKCFTRSPRTSLSKEMRKSIGRRSNLQDHKEVSTPGKSKGTEVTAKTPKSSKENDRNAACLLEPCSIERLGYADEVKIYNSAIRAEKTAQTTNMTDVSEVDKHVSTPTPRRKSPRSCFMSPTKEATGMDSVNIGTPKTGGGVLSEHNSFSEISAEIQREDSVCRNDSLQQLPLGENKCLKQRRNSKQHTPRKSAKIEVLKEICDQTYVDLKKRDSESPASDSKSPRRNGRQSEELVNKSIHSETPASGELTSELASPASEKSGSGRKRRRPRTSELPTEEALETNAVKEHHSESVDRQDSGAQQDLATDGCNPNSDVEDGSVPRPQRLSSKRRSGSADVLEGNEAVSEVNVSDLLAEEESGETTRVSQKRKSGDLLPPLGKRKRVSFGGHLSPELFDKSLPPNSPLKRGAIPARLSLPFGDSPRAVLKKAQGLRHFAVQELSVQLQKAKMSPKDLPAQTPPAASRPDSGKATPQLTVSSPAPYTKGRFSVSHITTPSPIAEEQSSVAKDTNTEEKSSGQVKTPTSNHVSQDDKTSMATPNKLTRSSQRSSKKTPMKRRSCVVAVINSKRRSGASTANLLVAKSWAEVVKLGVARPQAKAVKKRTQKGRRAKKITQSPKTPGRKIKGHFSTGHAESPPTIVVGRAYSTTVRIAGQVPKVVKNPILKQNSNMDDSFIGLFDLFENSEDTSERRSPSSTVGNSDVTSTCTAVGASEVYSSEESGEMVVSSSNIPDSSEDQLDCQDTSCFLREQESPKNIFEIMYAKLDEIRKAELEEGLDVDSVSIIAEKQESQVKLESKTPDEKLESVEGVSGIEQLLRTSKKKPEPAEVLAGIKQLMKTPEQKPEPAEALLGIKQLMKTPRQKPEPAEALSGIKQLMKTPDQKPEPAEALSGIKQLMKTPKQKPEPAEALSGIKQLMKTPRQKPEPAEALSGIKQLMKTPKQKPEPAEALSGIKRLMKTPNQKTEPAEVLSGIKRLMKTPKQKPEPAEALSGIKRLMKTPNQKTEPAEALSGIKRLMKTPKQKPEPAEVLSGIKQLMKTPEQKPEPAEALSGIKQLMKTPKQKPEPAEVLSGIKQLMETPEEKLEPAEALLGIKQLMETPEQKPEPTEVLSGIKQLLETPEEKLEPAEVLSCIKQLPRTPQQKLEPTTDENALQNLPKTPEQNQKLGSEHVMDPKQEGAGTPCTKDSHEYGEPKTILEDKGNTSQGEDSQQKLSTSEDHSTQRVTRGRPRKTAHPPSKKQCEKDLNRKELQGLEKKSIQEEMGEISSSIAKNTRRGRRTNPRMEKEIVSEHPGEKPVETVSLEETQGDTQRPRRGKTKEPKELKRPSEDLESREKDPSVLQKDPANRKQTLQESDINDTSGTEDDQSRKTEGASSSTQDENYQLQTDLKKSENTPDKGGVEDREEMLLSPQKRSRGMKNTGNTEALLPPKRGRRARSEQVEQASSEELHGTRRKLRKDQSAKLLQGDEQTPETAPTEESENRPKLEVNVTGKRGKCSRNARKHPTGVKADMCGMAPENTQNVEKAKETSETVTETQSPTKNERKVSLGDEAQNAQENTTKASQVLKSEPPSGETDTVPVAVLNLEANQSSVQEAKRTRNRRGKKDSSEKKADECAQDVNSLDLKPEYKSETEKSSPKESSASSCVEQSHQVMKDQKNTADTSVTALNSDSVAHRRQKRTRNEQEANEPKPTEILQENQTQNNRTTRQRVRGRKVHFEFEEASSEALGEERNLPGNEEGMTCKNDQREASENPVQVRRSRRRQVDSIPQAACSTFTKKETLIKDHSKDESFTKDQDPAVEAIPSSTEEVPLRGRRRRREVAVASQTASSLSLRKKRGLLEGDDKKTTVKEDQNPALGNNTAEAKSSASLRSKRGLSEADDKEESTNEEQNVLLESVPCAKAKPAGRGRRKETPPVSHTTNSISLRRKRGLPADNGGEEAPKDQNVPLGTVASSLKEDQPKRGRRNEAAILLEATGSTPAQGKRNLSRESSRNNHREPKKMISEKYTSQEKMDFSNGYSGKKISIASLAVSSSSLQGLPEDGKKETPGEQQGILLEVTPSAKGNPSKAGRRKIVPSKSEETSPTFLREKLVLPEDRGQKGVLKEGEGTALENNSSQEKNRPLRNKRRNVQFKPAAATSLGLNGNLPENGNISETQSLIPTGSEENNQSGKGKEVNPTQQTTSTSRRRKCLLPADDLPPKKLKSENENSSPRKGKRNQTEEKREGDVKTAQTAGGLNRTTRASTRASARMRK